MIDALAYTYYNIVRWPRSHGFGVQSPFAYDFITKVVRGSLSASESLALESKHPEPFRHRLLHRFYMRLSRRLQLKEWVANDLKTIDADYLRAGFGECELHGGISRSTQGLILSIQDNDSSIEKACLEKFLAYSNDRRVLVVEFPYRSKPALAFWQGVAGDSRVGVTFDLYYCGVAFFDKKLSKRSYKAVLKC